MSDLLTVSVGLPAGAFVLPLDTPRDELAAWAERSAAGRLGEGAEASDVAALAGALVGAAEDARQRDLITALAFCPDPRAGELARIEVSSVGAPPEAASLTVRDMANYLSMPTARSTGPAEIEFGDLPIGPAVRVRHQFVTAPPADAENAADAADAAAAAADDDDGEDRGQGTIVQTAAYAARPAETDRAVLLFVSWHALAYTDRLCALTDQLAKTLKMVPVDG